MTGGEHERDEHRAGPVDRARAVRIARLLRPCAASAGCRRRRSPASIQNRPCQPVVSTSTPPISGPSAPPAADAAPHSVIAFIWPGPDDGDRQQAHAAGEDRRAGRALDHAPADDAGGARGQRDQHARGDEQREAGEEDLAAPEHVAERARGHDHGGADERVAGHRPLQLGDRRVDVLADRRQQDRHRRRVRVDDQRRDARRGAGRRRPAGRSGPPRPSVLDRVVGLEVVDLVLVVLRASRGSTSARISASPSRMRGRRSPAGGRRSRRRW